MTAASGGSAARAHNKGPGRGAVNLNRPSEILLLPNPSIFSRAGRLGVALQPSRNQILRKRFRVSDGAGGDAFALLF